MIVDQPELGEKKVQRKDEHLHRNGRRREKIETDNKPTRHAAPRYHPGRRRRNEANDRHGAGCDETTIEKRATELRLNPDLLVDGEVGLLGPSQRVAEDLKLGANAVDQ